MILGEAKIELASSNMDDADDICECLKVLYSARTGEQGLDRDFGLSMDAVDRPMRSPSSRRAWIEMVAHWGLTRSRIGRPPRGGRG